VLTPPGVKHRHNCTAVIIVGPGADPGVQAVTLQVTFKSSRLKADITFHSLLHHARQHKSKNTRKSTQHKHIKNRELQNQEEKTYITEINTDI